MFASIFTFEIRRLAKSLSTYVYFVILFAVSFMLALLSGGAFPSVNFNIAGEKIMSNSPIIIDAFFGAINNYIGIIILVAVTGNAVLKDFRYDTYTLLFTTPVTKSAYLGGRFSGAMLITLLLLTAPAFGLMAGFASPWVSPDKMGAFRVLPYVASYFQSILPNALLLGAIFFAVSLIVRDIFVIWLSVAVYFVAITVSNVLFRTIDLQTLSALLDPMGNFAKRAQSKYWSTYEKNHLVYGLQGLFLINRVVWLTIGAAVWMVGYRIFSFSSAPKRLITRTAKPADNSKISIVPRFFDKRSLPHVHGDFSTKSYLRALLWLSADECRSMLRNTYFRIILLFGMLLLFAVSFQVGKIYDTQTQPVTYEMVEFFGGTFDIFMVVLTIMFAGELVWKARDFKMSNILDALPVPDWVYYVSKIAGLFFMQVILLAIVMLCGIVVQLFKGYTALEVGLYVEYIFGFKLIDLWLLAVLAVFIQTLCSNKYVGYFVAGLFYFWNVALAKLVFKSNLPVFASDPGVTYSAMNGFGHGVYPFVMYKLYWSAFALALAGTSDLLWARGTETSLKRRWAGAMAGSKNGTRLLVTGALLAFLGLGGYIFYNTNILNKYFSDEKQEELQARFEKQYRRYLNIPQPKITDVHLEVDLYPNTLGLHTVGQFLLMNKTQVAIDSVHLIVPASMTIGKLEFGCGAVKVFNDSDYAYLIYRLAKPLQPGDTTTLYYTADLITRGFQQNFTGLTTPLYNGTFINNTDFLPHIGYYDRMELTDNARRKKYGLGYRPTSNPMRDTDIYRNQNLFVPDADFIGFDAVVSTVPDQIAVAPGYLKGEWTTNGRRYFHYIMDKPILNFYSFLSARYTVRKEMWQDVSLEIYYRKGDEHNLDRMFNGMKKALTYYAANFSPNQHHQVRILEFPRYATFAQSFPNTIPFSEGIGFIADVDDSSKEDVDYPFYVTAHEVAHQWFAHQVVGADVEGSNVLSESLAQYGAIMVMEHEYGETRLHKFLKLEADKYLTARANESEKEKPWAFADAGQGYILYQKGGLMMHSLNKYIGADSLNKAIAGFLSQYAFHAPPYPTTLDLVRYIMAETPDSLKYVVSDAFMKITVYDNSVTDATVAKADGGYKADFTVASKKMYADSTGKETDAPSDNYVEVGIYKNRTELLQRTMMKLKTGDNKFSMVFKDKPYKVVVDPRLLLIDRKPDDNEKRFEDKK